MKTLAVYGGSFSPPHVAHGLVATWLLSTGIADEVALVPEYRHAFGKKSLDYWLRLELLDLFYDDLGVRGLSVSGIEEHLAEGAKPVYTIDVLRAFKEGIKEGTRRMNLSELSLEEWGAVRLVVGADCVAECADWKNWDEIVRDFDPIYVNRQGWEPVNPDAPMFPGISSTYIRERIRDGKALDGLVTRRVRDRLHTLPKEIWG